MTKKILQTTLALALAGAATQSSAAIIAFDASLGTFGTGTNWEEVDNGANTTTYSRAVSGSVTGSVITPFTNDGGTGPANDGQVVTYTTPSLAADTYNLWMRVYIDPAGNQSGSNGTTVGSGEDSLYVGVDFGTFTPSSTDSQTTGGGLSGDWATINNMSTDTTPTGGVGNSTWSWINLSDEYGSFSNAENVPTYTVASAGTQTFQIGNREMGLWIDGIAFVTSTETPTVAALDAALTPVPEPSTYALMAGFLALGLVMVRRRLS